MSCPYPIGGVGGARRGRVRECVRWGWGVPHIALGRLADTPGTNGWSTSHELVAIPVTLVDPSGHLVMRPVHRIAISRLLIHHVSLGCCPLLATLPDIPATHTTESSTDVSTISSMVPQPPSGGRAALQGNDETIIVCSPSYPYLIQHHHRCRLSAAGRFPSSPIQLQTAESLPPPSDDIISHAIGSSIFVPNRSTPQQWEEKLHATPCSSLVYSTACAKPPADGRPHPVLTAHQEGWKGPPTANNGEEQALPRYHFNHANTQRASEGGNTHTCSQKTLACPCVELPQTAEHVLLECPLYEGARRKHLSTRGRVWPPGPTLRQASALNWNPSPGGNANVRQAPYQPGMSPIYMRADYKFGEKKTLHHSSTLAALGDPGASEPRPEVCQRPPTCMKHFLQPYFASRGLGGGPKPPQAVGHLATARRIRENLRG
ncbi:hypothetical protein BC826DRAFT_1174190 [Russula brevipes]|nr:hypothetical protein BC826DRAFT_1174190 [Russula brevipes]